MDRESQDGVDTVNHTQGSPHPFHPPSPADIDGIDAPNRSAQAAAHGIVSHALQHTKTGSAIPPTPSQASTSDRTPIFQWKPSQKDPIQRYLPPPTSLTNHFTAKAALKLPQKYRDMGPLDFGGSGEVRRVLDTTLNRPMVIKILRNHLEHSPAVVRQFKGEAKLTAKLQHPGVVPVHEMGVLEDGRPYFTMKEITGKTLGEGIQKRHLELSAAPEQPSSSGGAFHNLLAIYHRVCETVAYAHDQGIIHRDLKPNNMMVGPYGEVKVLDWGISQSVVRRSATMAPRFEQAPPQPTSEAPFRPPPLPVELEIDAPHFQPPPGTPAYMAPELLESPPKPSTKASDVYALGATLYEILSGRPPYQGETAKAICLSILAGPPRPVGRWLSTTNTLITHRMPGEDLWVGAHLQRPFLPQELKRLCEWCMQRNPKNRPQDANEVAGHIYAYLEGVRQEDLALTLIEQADETWTELQSLKKEAQACKAEAKAGHLSLAPQATIPEKRPHWARQEAADVLERQADMAQLRYSQLLRTALRFAPHAPQIHRRLVDFYHQRHQIAEAAGDLRLAELLESLIIQHDHEGHYQDYLRGFCTISLSCETPRARVKLYRYHERNRRLETEFLQAIPTVPIQNLPLLWGSYLLRLEAPDHQSIDLPIFLRRGEKQIYPAANHPPLRLPKVGLLQGDEIFVAAGDFLQGSAEFSPHFRARARVFVDTFVIKKYPVTKGEYLQFINTIRPEKSKVPSCYCRDPHGGFTLRSGYRSSEPITEISWHAARAYAQWYGEKTQRPWRLPTEMEWEKAARGADGRRYPFGDHFDPSWACHFDSFSGFRQVAGISDFDQDSSPYGVMGMAGNITEWCADDFIPPAEDGDQAYQKGETGQSDPAALKVIKGGGLGAPDYLYQCAGRTGTHPQFGLPALGFRLAYHPRT